MRILDRMRTPLGALSFVADVHVANHTVFGDTCDEHGVNDRLRAIGNALNDAMNSARNYARFYDEVRVGTLAGEGFPALVVLGDLFDTSRPTAVEFREVLMTKNHHLGLELMLLRGNHDGPPNTSAIDALGCVSGISAVGEITLLRLRDADVLFVPFSRPPSGVTHTEHWLSQVRAARAVLTVESYQRVRLIATHVGFLRGTKVPAYMRDSGVDLDHFKLDELREMFPMLSHVVAGDFHKHEQFRRDDGVVFVNTGALVPNGFRDVGTDRDYGSVLRFEAGSEVSPVVMERHVVNGPRFYVVDTLRELSLAIEAMRGALYVRTSNESLREALAEELVKKSIKGFAIVERAPDVEPAPLGAEWACKGVDSIAAAVASYVDEMQLPHAVTREELRAAVAEQMGGSR